jgi:large subunit ribosomal protein L15
MDLTNLSQGVHKRKPKKRVGRGTGSGHGKTSSRGHKGQYASAGAKMFGALFEGGQMPLFRRTPKRGFSNNRFRDFYEVVNVADLNAFDDGATVDLAALKAKRLAQGPYDGVVILGDGELTRKLTVRVHRVSKSARQKIEAKGGTIELIAPPKKPVRNKMKPRPPKAGNG